MFETLLITVRVIRALLIFGDLHSITLLYLLHLCDQIETLLIFCEFADCFFARASIND